MPKLHAIIVAASNDGWWAGALVALLTTIGAGSWKLLSDSTNRVDAAGKEGRDRLDKDLDAMTKDRDYWRDHYFAATQHKDRTDES